MEAWTWTFPFSRKDVKVQIDDLSKLTDGKWKVWA